MDEIIKDIINSFNSLWKIKRRGNTIEIVTPVATSNNMFVSVFLTKRGDEYIITDGGWMDSGMYDCELSDEVVYQKIMDYYMDSFGILQVEGKGLTYYFKKTSNPIMVPSLVFDLSSFVEGIISSSCIDFSAKTRELHKFTFKAKRYLHDILPENRFVSPHKVRELIPAVRFGAAIEQGSKISLVNFVSGSDDAYYTSSLCKSNASYEIADKYSASIEHKITMLDDSLDSYKSEKVLPFLELYKHKGNCLYYSWTEREEVKKLIG